MPVIRKSKYYRLLFSKPPEGTGKYFIQNKPGSYMKEYGFMSKAKAIKTYEILVYNMKGSKREAIEW